MGFTRRAILAVAGLAGLSGCTEPKTNPSEGQQTKKPDNIDRTSQQSNKRGELTRPVNNEWVRTSEQSTVISPHANIKAYGAVGDGSVDDTQTFRDARDAVDVGDTIFVPDGDFLISESFELQGRSLKGVGRHTSTIIADRGGVWKTGGPSNATAVIYTREDCDMSITALGVDGQGEDAAGIAAFGGDNIEFTNNFVRDTSDSGIQLYGNDLTDTSCIRDATVTDNLVKSCEWNYVMDGHVLNSAIQNNRSRDAGTAHVSIDNDESAETQEIRACIVSGNTCWGHTTINNSPSGAIRSIGSGNTIVHINDNYIYDWPETAILLANTTGRVSENTLQGNESSPQSIGVLLDRTKDGLLITGNSICEADVGIKSQNRPDWPRIMDNVLKNVTTEFNITMQSDWVIERNYTNDGTDVSP
ncbi:pectate lyase family protein [Halorussus litoreus]|uniref:glycosyl hydrolase family 28-related protein n=1 Tax=Halorussus litoreus TaxID=1710536 RepID=UPI000E279279|nr:glycosyl hydrolase family 28-related protein [Halorussus litoreus]